MPPKQPTLTHFLAIPLASSASRPALNHALAHLRTRLPAATAGEVDPSTLGRALRPLSSLHLTIGVMALDTDAHVKRAVELLDAMDVDAMLADAAREVASLVVPSLATAVQTEGQKAEQSEPPPPIRTTLVSLGTFQREARASVLYAEPIDSSGRLLPFCRALHARFRAAGLLQEENRELKLHATVLNMRYARGGKPSRGGRGGAGKGTPKDVHKTGKAVANGYFDARELIAEFEGFVWAEEIRLERLALCTMGATQVHDEQGNLVDEAYGEVATRSLPAA